MKRMRKFTLLFILFMTMCMTAKADWTPSDSVYTVIGEDGSYEQSTLHTLLTPEGNTIVTWIQKHYTTRMRDPDGGFYLYMQVVEKDGTLRFPKEGLLVSNKPTPTYFTDYAIALAPNGDVLLAFYDTRDDDNKLFWDGYLYRYTQNGEAVWDKDGIEFPIVPFSKTAMSSYTYTPQIAVNGSNIYVTFQHSEYYKTKADSTNWKPNYWRKDTIMPDSVYVENANIQMQRVNDDGTLAWENNKVYNLTTNTGWLVPSDNGSIIAITCKKADFTLWADKVDADGNSLWADGYKRIANESLGTNYMTAPSIISDGNNGALMTYKVPIGVTGYIGFHHLYSDGTISETALNPRADKNGLNNYPILATRDQKVLLVWQYAYDAYTRELSVNLVSQDEEYLWTDTLKYGKSLQHVYNLAGLNVTPVKIIPQEDGWVVFYGNPTAPRTDDFMVVKMDDEGTVLWRKRILEPSCNISDINIEYDGKYAYVYYLDVQKYDDEGNPIAGPGAMRVLCTDISNEGNADNATGITTVSAKKGTGTVTYYNLNGMRIDAPTKGIYIVKDADGNVSKRIKK